MPDEWRKSTLLPIYTKYGKKAAPSTSQAAMDDLEANNASGKSDLLIKFAENPACSDMSALTQAQQISLSKDSKIATSEPPTVQNFTSVPNKNTLEFVLFELSTPAEAPGSNHPGASSSDNIQAAGPPGGTPTFPMSGASYPTPHQHVQASSHIHSATMSASSDMPIQHANNGVPEVSDSGMALMMPSKGGASHAVPHAHLQALCCTRRASMNASSNRPTQPPNAGVPEVSAAGMALMMPSNAAASSLAATTHAARVGPIPVLSGTPFNITTDKLMLTVSSARVTASPVQKTRAFPRNSGGASMAAHSQAMTASLGGILAPSLAPLGMPTQLPNRGTPPGMVPSFLIDGGNSSAENADRQQFPSVPQPQHSARCVSESSSPAQQTLAFHGVANNKPRELLLAANSQEHCSNSSVQTSQSSGGPVQDTDSVAGAQPNPPESKPSGRSELPADLFTAVYPPGPTTVPGW